MYSSKLRMQGCNRKLILSYLMGFTQGSGTGMLRMAQATCSKKMVVTITETLLEAGSMATEDWFMPMDFITREIGSMVRLMEPANLSMMMAPLMKASFRRICSTVMESKHSLMDKGMRVPFSKAKNMARENLSGQMKKFTRANLLATLSLVMGLWTGVTVKFTRGSGCAVKCTELESLRGKMAENMWASFRRIWSTATENWLLIVTKCIWGIGARISKMVLVWSSMIVL